MKHNKIIVFILFFVSATPVFASVTYSRSPSGLEITSPVTLHVELDDINDLNWNNGTPAFWGVFVQGIISDVGASCVDASDLNQDFVVNLPVGYQASSIETMGADTIEECTIDLYQTQGDSLESGGSPEIFTVISGEQLAAVTLFARNQATTTANNIGSVLVGWIPSLLAFLAALIGLGIAVRYIKRWIGRK